MPSSVYWSVVMARWLSFENIAEPRVPAGGRTIARAGPANKRLDGLSFPRRIGDKGGGGSHDQALDLRVLRDARRARRDGRAAGGGAAFRLASRSLAAGRGLGLRGDFLQRASFRAGLQPLPQP